MGEEIRFGVQVISELNSQLLKPAAVKVTFRRKKVQRFRVRHFGRFIEQEITQPSNQQVSIWIPAGDSPDIRVLVKTLGYRTMTAMGIPESVHAEIMEKITSKSNGYCTWILVEIEMVRTGSDFFRPLDPAEGEGGGFGEGRMMIPATKSSIEGLERLAFEDDDSRDTTCAVCMETLDVGVEAIRLPCFHLYHRDCIVKWLQVSHYCPLCRHDMPAIVNHQ